MEPMSRRRKATLAAAWTGGALGGLGAIAGALFGLVIGETKLARRRIPQAMEDPPVSHNTIWAAAGVSSTRPPIRLAVLGDSSAAGYGVRRDRDTPAAQLANGISAILRRPVHVTNVAVVGSESRQLAAQLDELGGADFDVALIMIGANDVTHRIRPADAVPYLADAVGRLRTLGAEVVVGTCPDLGTIRPLAQPLRSIARRLSRTMAKEQTIAVVAAGGRTVSLGDLLGPLFAGSTEFFSDDQFHPSAAGYAAAADALLPSMLDSLGMGTRARSASTFTTRRAKPVSKAAAQAAHHPGTEVVGADRHGRGPSRRGTLARLRRRRPRRPVPTSPESARPVIPGTVD
jgi:lysophospholipase L1-like esterase